jgi:hypothetical protein
VIEPAVTIVRCRACRHSERLTLNDGRFWCAWCQRWADVDADQVIGAAVVLDGEHFRLVPATTSQDWQQPLRIPSGWLIGSNSFAEDDIDPTNASYGGYLNLFWATNEQLRRAVEVEWHSDPGPPVIGRYHLRVLPLVAVESHDDRRKSEPPTANWDAPVHDFETAERVVLVAELEACLRGERG